MKSVRLFVAGAALCTLFSAINFSLAQGTAFTYQGFLNDGGSPANGSYDLSFAAYDAPTSGTLLGGIVTSPAVAIKNGVFSVHPRSSCLIDEEPGSQGASEDRAHSGAFRVKRSPCNITLLEAEPLWARSSEAAAQSGQSMRGLLTQRVADVSCDGRRP
jgi:hypothetical protein